MESKELICECGDTESQHIDNCEQCVIPECGCKSFVEESSDDVCEYCHGTGEVPKLMLDNSDNMPSGGAWVESGELETCICKIEK